MADDMYFNLTPDPVEKAVVEYIIEKIDSLSEKSSSPIRYQKVIIDVANKLGLPITTLWYKMGKITGFECQPNIGYDEKEVLSVMKEEIGSDKIEQLDETVKKSVSIFSEDLEDNEIREKQYVLYEKEDYLCLLELSSLLGYGFEDNKKDILFQLSRFLNLILKEQNYLEFYDKFFNFVVLLKQIVYSNSDFNEGLIKETFKSYAEYYANLEGIRTAEGKQADRIKRKIQNNMDSIKYRTISSFNELKRTYEANTYLQNKLWVES